MIVRRTTTKLDGTYLVLNLLEYDDKSCRAEVVFSMTGHEDPKATVVMIQQQSSIELAVAIIARDFSTFAERTLASLPFGHMPDPDYEEEDEI